MTLPRPVDLAHLSRYTGGDARINAEILTLFANQSTDLLNQLGDALSGVELAQRAVALGIQVIAMTGFPRLPDGVEGAALLTKPFSADAVRLVFDMLRLRGGA